SPAQVATFSYLNLRDKAGNNNYYRDDELTALGFDVSSLTLNLTSGAAQFGDAASSGSESVTSVSVPVVLSAAVSQDVTVDYSVTGGTATGGGVDYTLAGSTATIAAGNTTTNIALTVVDDSLYEGDETIIITLSNPSNNATLGSNATHTYTIIDDDPQFTVQFTAATSSGSEKSNTAAEIAIELSTASLQDVSVNYAVTGGTATGSGVDYTLADGTATIAAGSTTTNIALAVADDSLYEGDETIIITLSNPSNNATLGSSTTHTYTISAPPPTFTDVPATHAYFNAIETLYNSGYISGCSSSPLKYCPGNTMSRAQSAVLVLRGANGPSFVPPQPNQAIFADLPLSNWAAKWAAAMYNGGFTSGCGSNPLRYCPGQGLTRAQGSVFFLRIKFGSSYTPPSASGVFSDMASTFWGAKWAEVAYNEGLIPACETGPALRFCADDPLDRGLAAHMMVQAKGLQ
ncbi:MAG TPA: Calx-beta domain-containing protein, partial [Anaerolineales bacterium]|nr:Calx-beta domain-containing protein [Anaerolineales bacterium]